MFMPDKVFVVISAYNEEAHIKDVVEGIKNYIDNNVDKIVVVDDGSKDKTKEIAEKGKVFVLSHLVNLGKGAALKTGCDYALEQGAEKIIVLDADGQHEPKEIPLFLKALDKVDIVYSFRKRSSQMPLVLRFGNNFINSAIQSLFNIKISDSQCGYRAFSAEAYKKIRWNATDYFMETEMIIRASRNKLRYTQIPIETIYSDNYKGTTVFDGVKIFFKIVWGKFL